MKETPDNQAAERSNVLIYLLGSLGDTIISIPALRAARRRFPDAHLIVLHDFQSNLLVTPQSVVPPELADEFMSYSHFSNRWRNLRELWQLRGRLRRKKIAAAVYLAPTERAARSVARDKFFFRSCGIKTLIGFHPFNQSELYPVDERNLPAVTETEALRKLRRLERDKMPVNIVLDLQTPLLTPTAAERRRAQQWLQERRRKPQSRLVAICPGCKTKANVWDNRNFIELGKRFIQTHNDEIVLLGGAAERAAGDEITAAWGEGLNAAGEFTVRESAAIFAECGLVVSLDTGTIHLAAAVGARCLGLYGERNNPGQWFPLGEQHLVVYHPVDCAGCRAAICPRSGHPCMTRLTPENVWQAARQNEFDQPHYKTSVGLLRVAV